MKVPRITEEEFDALMVKHAGNLEVLRVVACLSLAYEEIDSLGKVIGREREARERWRQIACAHGGFSILEGPKTAKVVGFDRMDRGKSK